MTTNTRAGTPPVLPMTSKTLVLLAVLALVGCGKPASTSTANTPTPAAEPAPPPVETRPQTETQKSAVTEAVAKSQSASSEVKAQSASTLAKAQSMIDEAKKLIENAKVNEAVRLLNDVSNLKLTPEQQALVDTLKQKAQKFLADAAAKKAAAGASKAIGDALKTKP